MNINIKYMVLITKIENSNIYYGKIVSEYDQEIQQS